jgi:hypothetical protein
MGRASRAPIGGATHHARGPDAAYLQFLAREHNAINSASDGTIARAWREVFSAVDHLIRLCAQRVAASAGADDLRDGVAQALEPMRDKVALALEPIRQRFRLPLAVDRNRGGRPSSFLSDAIAFAASEHFRQKTGSPQWRQVSQLLNVGNPRAAMTARHVRQRVDRWRRSREKVLFELVAHSYKRSYETKRRTTTT